MAEENVAVDPKIEASAREMGWVPKDQFRGGEDKWVDAETFVKRGEEVMPILKSQNKRLHQELDGLRGQLSETQELVKAGQEAITALKESQTEFTKQAVTRAKSEIRAKLREAREANDMDAIGELEDQLDDIREAERDVKAAAKAPAASPAASPAAPKIDPEFVAWQRENPWFGTDRRRTALVLAEAEELRADRANANLLGRAFYDKAAANADAILNPRSTTSKVENGSGSATPHASGSGGAKKSYRDLPSDAKGVCDRQAAMLVGPGRAFKTLAEWQQNYADQFFAE
jgi:hypothetical protein